MLTGVNSPSQMSKQGSAAPMVTFYGPSGTNLLRACQAAAKLADRGNYTTQEAIDGSFCRGYVAGVVDAMVGLSVQTETVYCIPSNADTDQFVRVVLKYLKDNPATLHHPAGALVANAIVTAFPCR
jgi:hypothetical protein